jgi:hypothetical protein
VGGYRRHEDGGRQPVGSGGDDRERVAGLGTLPGSDSSLSRVTGPGRESGMAGWPWASLGLRPVHWSGQRGRMGELAGWAG